jgi:hypothetical protein
MTRTIRLAAATLLLAPLASVSPGAAQESQTTPPPPCSAPEASQFDFWVGEWDLTWEGGKGTNTITSILGSCVIQEQFDGCDAEGKGLVGLSHSVYNPRLDQWQQTWVDNQGSYLEFTGGMAGDTMVLSREATRDGKTFQQRMVFSDIKDNALNWSWERSDDGGKTWTPVWVISYQRR